MAVKNGTLRKSVSSGVGMSKRFTDTSKWDKPWFRKLSIKLKCLWLFLCDRCDHAGVWSVDTDAASFQLGTRIELEDLKALGERRVQLFDRDEKLWVVPFFEFQYGFSKEGFKARDSAQKILEKHGLVDSLGVPRFSLSEELDNTSGESGDFPSIGIGIGTVKKGGMGENKKSYSPEFESLYDAYPRKEGKSPGFKTYRKEILTLSDQVDLRRAIENYAQKKAGTEAKFLLNFSTFMNQWRDWLDERAGTSSTVSADLQAKRLKERLDQEQREANPEFFK